MSTSHRRFYSPSFAQGSTHGAVQGAPHRGDHEEAFRSLIGAASDRSSSEEWIDSLSYAAGPERELLADDRGVYEVRRAREDVECGAADEAIPARGWVS